MTHAADSGGTPGRRWTPRSVSALGGPRAWTAVLLVVLGTVAVVMLHLGRAHWFFGDDWDFLLQGGVHDRNLYLRPTNGHWMGATMVVFAGARWLVGLQSHGVYLVPVVASHVGLAAVLWVWQRRDGVRPSVATALASCFLVYGAAGENIFFAVNVGFNLSLLLGLHFGLLLEDARGRHRRRRLVAASVIALLAVPTTTTGPLLVAAIGLSASLRRDRRGAVLGAGPALVVYGAWRLAASAGPALDRSSPGDVATFFVSLVTTAVGRLLGAGSLVAAAVVLAGLACAVVVWRPVDGARARPLTITVALVALATAALTAVSRAPLGVEMWRSPRYAYVVAALALPLVGVVVDRLSRVSVVHAGVLAVALPVAIATNGAALHQDQDDQAKLEQHLRHRWLAAAQLLDEGTRPLSPFVDQFWNPSLDVDGMRHLLRRGELPVPAAPIAHPWRWEARVELRSRVGGDPPRGPLDAPVLGATDATSCRHLEPGETIGFDAPTGGGLRFLPERSTIARVWLTNAEGVTTALPRLLGVPASGETLWFVIGERVSGELALDVGGRVCSLPTA